LEKQVNKLNKFLMLDKSIKLFLTVLVLGNIFQAKAQEQEPEQDRVPFSQGREYILAEVKVIGKVSYNEQTIVTFAGLQKGQKIIVPGEEISTAIKNYGNWDFLMILILTSIELKVTAFL